MTLIRQQRGSDLWNWSPLERLSRLQEDLNRIFETGRSDAGPQGFNTWAPALDLFEDKDQLVVTLEAPGMKKDGFDISLHDGVLTVSGERRFEQRSEQASVYRTERFEGRFQRSVVLPKAVNGEKVTASYQDGILTVNLPVAEEAKPKQIAVNAS